MTDRNCTIQNPPKQVKSSSYDKSKSFDRFLIRARAKFGDRFVYSKESYQTTQKKMKITCKKHGSFWQAPCDHLRDKTKHACLECSNESFCSTHADFIKRARTKHKNVYSYPDYPLKKLHDFVPILCSKHGLFKQQAYSHLAGFGCNDCANEANRKSTETFIKEANLVHGVGLYDYSKVEYVKGLVDVEIICPEHGPFFQKPASHIGQGAGCPICACQNKGWERSAFKGYCDKNNNGYGFLYVIRCKKDFEDFYKIGITSREITKRFYPSNLPYEYDVKFLIREEANFIYDLEFRLHNVLHDCKYSPSENFAGSTECFSDIRRIIKLLKKLSSNHQYQLIA